MRHDDPSAKKLPRAFVRDVGTAAATATERRALNAIRNGPLTRAEVARALDVSSMSATRIAESLIGRGLIKEVGRIGEGKGPSIGLALVPDAAYSAGVAIMTDTVSIALMDVQGARVAERSVPQKDMRQGAALDRVAELLEALLHEHLPSPERLFGIGVAITGYFTGTGTQVNPPPELDEWAMTDIEPLFEKRFRRPVWLDNDGNAAAVGEALYGVGRRIRRFAYLYFSTGFGGGVIQDGELLRGRLGNAGEYAGIVDDEAVRPRLEELRQFVCEDDEPIESVYELVSRFDPQWNGVARWLDAVTPGFSRVIWACSAILDPDAVVFGGRIPPALAQMMIDRVEYVDRYRRGHLRARPDLLLAETPGEATAIGAAAVPFREVFFL